MHGLSWGPITPVLVHLLKLGFGLVSGGMVGGTGLGLSSPFVDGTAAAVDSREVDIQSAKFLTSLPREVDRGNILSNIN